MAKRLAADALLLTAALIIFIVEARIPPIVPVPGVKLGLANIITVYAIWRVGPRDAFLILIARVILGSIFTGQMMAFLYSLGGGLLCFAAMLLVRKILTEKQIWIASVIGALFHNIGQTLVAVAVFRTVNVAYYFPVLLLSGLVTGLFTGIAAQALIRRMRGKIEP